MTCFPCRRAAPSAHVAGARRSRKKRNEANAEREQSASKATGNSREIRDGGHGRYASAWSASQVGGWGRRPWEGCLLASLNVPSVDAVLMLVGQATKMFCRRGRISRNESHSLSE